MLDVVIIGAGLSGLQAALSCKEAGLSLKVLEARDRVGGKTWSIPLKSGCGKMELGAAWINPHKQHRVGRYARHFNLHTVKQRVVGKAVMQTKDGRRFEHPFGTTPGASEEERKDLERVRDHISAISLKPADLSQLEDDKATVDEYVRNLDALPSTLLMANLWTQVMHGVESTEESAAFFMDYCRHVGGFPVIRADDETGGNYLRIIEGTLQIANGIAALLGHANIQLSSPVSSVKQQRQHVEVTTVEGRKILARRCIMSIPSAMFRTIDIFPSLPKGFESIANASRLGDYTKVVVCYNTPWWREMGFNGIFNSFVGPVSSGRDTCIEETKTYCITCFVNGENSRRWSRLSLEDRKNAILKQLASIFNVGPDHEVYRPLEVQEQIWKNEQYSHGALTPIPALGHYTRHADVYGKSFQNMHFVGTEYSREWKGYMEGALCSGEQGAAEVIALLKQTKALASAKL
ncbi:hypothetical protein LTR84_000669 [Exophiala bonariae]|uniref:Amine oxidase n=1 Tax=Exophiala bonariae TaxID=1690606 RepID=A0AAV9NTS7_9EURO|nr:hypothetical protein LTR84_000669 [Exophiala bonariae]